VIATTWKPREEMLWGRIPERKMLRKNSKQLLIPDGEDKTSTDTLIEAFVRTTKE
jgi:hypothetical protein